MGAQSKSSVDAVTEAQAQLFLRKVKDVPLTADGHPTGIWLWRNDDDEPEWVLLDYHEGFPLLPDGSLFWERLPNEPMPSYMLFADYLHAWPLSLVQYSQRPKSKITETGLRALYALFWWRERIKAYQSFQSTYREVVRGITTQNMLDKHSTVAKTIFGNVWQVLEKVLMPNAQGLIPLSATEMLDALKTAVAMERISLGLPAGAPRAIENKKQVIDVNVTKTDTSRAAELAWMEKIMENPETLAMAQKIAVAMQQPERPKLTH